MRRRGISLIEIVVSLLIVGILLAVGIPAFKAHQVAQTARTEADRIVSALKLAHSGRIGWYIDPHALLAANLPVPPPGPPPLAAAQTELNSHPSPMASSFQLEQIAGGTAAASQEWTALDAGVGVQVNALDGSVAVPDNCTALAFNTAAGMKAVVFLPSGQLFSLPQASIDVFAPSAADSTLIQINAQGAISLATTTPQPGSGSTGISASGVGGN